MMLIKQSIKNSHVAELVDAGRFQRLDGRVGEIADSREDSNTQYSKL